MKRKKKKKKNRFGYRERQGVKEEDVHEKKEPEKSPKPPKIRIRTIVEIGDEEQSVEE